ncbi:MAG: hypothetical protein KDA97_10780, partial [Acidimicrobiales bacterium]|nr:hypothetical protein [Acidimicrobiales bacterium]
VAAGSDDPTIEVGDVGFTPAAADGACGIDHRDGRTVVTANRERRITLRADGGNSAPAADPGPDQRVEATGTVVVLDGTASCDLDGDALTHRWELVSAPAGSAWELSGAATARPALSLDAVGPYRVRLTVTDARGATSLEQEVVILAGPVCGDGVDDDLDGRFDTDDPDCDGSRTPVTPTDPVAPADPVAPLAPPAEAVGGRPRYTG